MLTVREGSGRFMTAAPLSKGELLRAKSGTGGLSNLSGDGERSGIIPTPWAGASASGESWPASQAWAPREVPAGAWAPRGARARSVPPEVLGQAETSVSPALGRTGDTMEARPGATETGRGPKERRSQGSWAELGTAKRNDLGVVTHGMRQSRGVGSRVSNPRTSSFLESPRGWSFILGSRVRVSVGTACGIVRPSVVSVRDQMPVAKMGDRTQPNGRST
jgi:hypothetical protein